MTRIMKLPKHNSVVLGRDLDNVFKPNMVYGVKKYLGEIVLTELGESILSEKREYFPNANSDVRDIIQGSSYLLTKNDPGHEND